MVQLRVSSWSRLVCSMTEVHKCSLYNKKRKSYSYIIVIGDCAVNTRFLANFTDHVGISLIESVTEAPQLAVYPWRVTQVTKNGAKTKTLSSQSNLKAPISQLRLEKEQNYSLFREFF